MSTELQTQIYEALTLGAKRTCELTCQSVWKTDERQQHSDECKRLKAARSAWMDHCSTLDLIASGGFEPAMTSPTPSAIRNAALEEAAARAVCEVKMDDPNALHQNYPGDKHPIDATGTDGREYHFGWRNQLPVVNAVIRALSLAPGTPGEAVACCPFCHSRNIGLKAIGEPPKQRPSRDTYCFDCDSQWFSKVLYVTPAVVPEGWRTIESAPKDGSDVLLYFPLEGLSKDFDCVIICYWREASDNHNGRGHWVWQSRAVRGYSDEYQPTHWQPLPAAPHSPGAP